VFSAGSVTSERERETLDLLLTTTITPWQILWGKLIAGLRVSSVLTLFLVWPVLLACVMVSLYWTNILAVIAYLAIVLITCVTTAMLALFCSVLFKKTSHAMMSTYMVIIVIFCAPLAANFFAQTFFPTHPNAPYVAASQFVSPFGAAFEVPLDLGLTDDSNRNGISGRGDWRMFLAYTGFSLVFNGGLIGTMMWMFNIRWRVAG